MSGGSFDYACYTIEEVLSRFGEDTRTRTDFPQVTAELDRLKNLLYDVTRAIEWHYSGDTIIENRASFDASWAAILSGGTK